MDSPLLQEIPILKLAEVHSKPDKQAMAYGTAGFRGKASKMDHIFFRMGMLAVLRSKMLKSAIGVMVTASHNPVLDNGVKLIDPCGEMLVESWEVIATGLANASNDDLVKELKKIVAKENIDLSQTATILLARDTRPSSLSLSNAVQDGISALGGTCRNYGLLTTPQLHYIVSCYNDGVKDADEDTYYKWFSSAFKTLVNEPPVNSNVTVDCANGVGAPKLNKLYEHIGANVIDIIIHNDGEGCGKLNEKCGADYVKIQQRAPIGLNMEPFHRYASFDGDADRIVYYSLDCDCNFVLLDGDKIASLITLYIKELLDESKVDVKLGMVQTAYANGNSTRYVTDTLNVMVACARTGVKHLHHKAVEFDIGVYFEANGHGTVTVKEECSNVIERAAKDDKLPAKQKDAAIKLKTFLDVINKVIY
ncbi:unnamed protein product [Clavelina lepadiformis]|uniref:Phosphoacetylglucosamine mutase n=1 Tax=Clavelina lepadiformis TaxID=159417 RepID=A0ABP0FWK9_CLALP